MGAPVRLPLVGVLVVAVYDLERVLGRLPEEQFDEQLGLIGRRRGELPQDVDGEFLQLLWSNRVRPSRSHSSIIYFIMCCIKSPEHVNC